jgi:hypothetical protein
MVNFYESKVSSPNGNALVVKSKKISKRSLLVMFIHAGKLPVHIRITAVDAYNAVSRQRKAAALLKPAVIPTVFIEAYTCCTKLFVSEFQTGRRAPLRK